MQYDTYKQKYSIVSYILPRGGALKNEWVFSQAYKAEIVAIGKWHISGIRSSTFEEDA